MAVKGPERWTTGIALPNGLSGAMQAVGGFFSMSMDAVLARYLEQGSPAQPACGAIAA